MKNLSLPTNIFRDERIVAIAGEFGNAAQLVVVQLLCEIAAAGYFIEWNTLKQNFYARMFCMPTLELCAIVNRLADYGFFSKEMIEQDQVLTNEDCQRRYFRPRTRRRVITGIPHLIIPLVQWIPEEPKSEEQPKVAEAQITPEPVPAQVEAPKQSCLTKDQVSVPNYDRPSDVKAVIDANPYLAKCDIPKLEMTFKDGRQPEGLVPIDPDSKEDKIIFSTDGFIRVPYYVDAVHADCFGNLEAVRFTENGIETVKLDRPIQVIPYPKK